MRRTCVPPNFTRSTKLQCAQSSPEVAFRSTNFRAPENQIFPALERGVQNLGKKDYLIVDTHFVNLSNKLT